MPVSPRGLPPLSKERSPRAAGNVGVGSVWRMLRRLAAAIARLSTCRGGYSARLAQRCAGLTPLVAACPGIWQQKSEELVGNANVTERAKTDSR